MRGAQCSTHRITAGICCPPAGCRRWAAAPGGMGALSLGMIQFAKFVLVQFDIIPDPQELAVVDAWLEDRRTNYLAVPSI